MKFVYAVIAVSVMIIAIGVLVGWWLSQPLPPKLVYNATVIDKVDQRTSSMGGSETKCVITNLKGQRVTIDDYGPCLYLVGETVEVWQIDPYRVVTNYD